MSANTEYFLPSAVNRFLVESGIAADGPALDEIARLVAESMRPSETLTIERIERIDVHEDGNRWRARVRARTESGVSREWQMGFGEGPLAGQLRLVRELEMRGGTRVVIRTMAPAMVKGLSSHDLSIGAPSDTFTMAGYPGEIFLNLRYNATPTGNRVTFSLTDFFDDLGFPEAGVHVRVRSTIPAYGPDFLAPQAVAIDAAGNGSYTWNPGGNGLTGLCFAEVGTLDGGGAFVARADVSPIALTIERLRAIRFPGGTPDSCRIRYCEQFFQSHPQGTAHAETFIGYVINGLNDSWTSQVTDWALTQGHADNEPQDADDVHECFVTDHVQVFRGATTGGSAAWAHGNAREMWIRNNGYYADGNGTVFATPLWSSEDLRTRSAVFHEFVHGIQAGWLDGILGPNGNWITEGTARFLPTVRYETEEFLENTQHLYPLDTWIFLRTGYQQALTSQSYRGAAFWRFLYEKNRPAGTTAQRVALTRRVWEQIPGRSGFYHAFYPQAVGAALAADGGAFGNWEACRDSFLHVLWRHDWTPNSPSIVFPAVTGDPDSNRISATWNGTPLEVNDAIANRHAMDFWNFRMDPAANLQRLSLVFDPDPDRNNSFATYHLSVLLYKGGSNTARVPVLPRVPAAWDSTFEVKGVDSVVVCVLRSDTLAANPDATYRMMLSPPLAVDAPDSDEIQSILTALGPRYRHVVVDETHLQNASFPWRRYDVIFLNCSGTSATVAPLAKDSLRAFVARGGYLYASDYDYEYVARAWPGAIEFGENNGAGQTVTATVTDPGLIAVLGSGTAAIEYDLDDWVTVTRPGPDATVHLLGTFTAYESEPMQAERAAHGHRRLRHASAQSTHGNGGDSRTAPLLLSFAHDKGRVIYTTFHNSAQTTAAQQALLRYMIYRQSAGDLMAGAFDAMTAGYTSYQQVVNGINPGQTQALGFSNPLSTAMEAILNWGGSEMRVTARRPNGTVFGSVQGTQPPIKLSIPAGESGQWTFDVRALDVPDSNYAFALLIAGEQPIPGRPAVDAIGEAPICVGSSSLVSIPIRNLALYADSFHVSASSDDGWSVAPADTTIHAWEGMRDSLYLRVEPPPGTPPQSLDSLRVIVTSLTESANVATGARRVRVRAGRPSAEAYYEVETCPGTPVAIDTEVTVNVPCRTEVVAWATSASGWSVSPESLVVTVDPEEPADVRFTVTPPGDATDGETDVVLVHVRNAHVATLRDSVEHQVTVGLSPPEAMVPPPMSSLRGTELAPLFSVGHYAPCPSLYRVTLRDSLGWPIEPDSIEGELYQGVNSFIPTIRIPANAPQGVTNRVRLVATPLSLPLPPDTAWFAVTVEVPGEVLVVDVTSGGWYGGYAAQALDAAGRTHSDWYTWYTPPNDTILGQFERVVWLGGADFGLSGADTTHLGRYLRGGGRMLVSGQDVLGDITLAQPFVAAYFGASKASENGSFAVQGRTGAFLASLPPTPIEGGDGAWNQYAPDELNAIGGGVPILDYLEPEPGAARLEPPAAARVLWAPPRSPSSIAASIGHRRAIEAQSTSGAEIALTTGIAGIANDPGTWRTVFLGFGYEALDNGTARRNVMDEILEFFDAATTHAGPATPRQLALAVSPNPSGADARFAVDLPQRGHVRLALYDLLGREVRVLHDSESESGRLALVWDGLDGAGHAVKGGLFFARLEVAGARITRKVVRLAR